jgi:membrane-associated phospholipid phosphatase
MLKGSKMSSIPVSSQRSAQPHPYPHAVPHGGFIAVEAPLLAAIAVLSLLVRHHPGPLPTDVGLELDVQHWLLPHPAVASPIEAVSTINWPVPAAITLAAIIGIFLLLRRWLDAIVTLIAAAVTDETSYLLNQLVHRPRPTGFGIHVVAVGRGTFSFPSGHVTHAVAVFGLFLFLTTQVRRPLHPALVWAVRVCAAAIIVLMSLSRILEGQHWPTDVLGGLLYGAFALVIFAHLYLWARQRWPVLLAADER